MSLSKISATHNVLIPLAISLEQVILSGYTSGTGHLNIKNGIFSQDLTYHFAVVSDFDCLVQHPIKVEINGSLWIPM